MFENFSTSSMCIMRVSDCFCLIRERDDRKEHAPLLPLPKAKAPLSSQEIGERIEG